MSKSFIRFPAEKHLIIKSNCIKNNIKIEKVLFTGDDYGNNSCLFKISDQDVSKLIFLQLSEYGEKIQILRD